MQAVIRRTLGEPLRLGSELLQVGAESSIRQRGS
jgi:hypothetical protein